MGNPTVSEAVQPRVPPPRAWGRAYVSIAQLPRTNRRWPVFGDTQTLLFFLQKAKWFLTVLSLASQTL